MMPNTLSDRDSVAFIRDGLLSGRPFMAGKVGTGDNETMLRWIDIHDRESTFVKWMKLLVGKRRPFWWDNSIRAGIGVCAGVFQLIENLNLVHKIFGKGLTECKYVWHS